MKKNFKKINCPICNQKDFNKLFSKENEDFVKCVGCGLVYINPQPSLEALEETYHDNYVDIYVKKAKSKYRRSKKRIKKLLKLNKSYKTSLDIGCSAGFVVQAANDLGLEAYGVEIEKSGPKYAKEVLKLNNIYNGFLEEAKYNDNFFDIITFYEVLEHVPSLDSFLKEVHRILKVDGIVNISVPDAGHWSSRNNLENWNAIIPSEHLWYFSSSTIRILLEKYRFKEISIKSKLFKANLIITFQK